MTCKSEFVKLMHDYLDNNLHREDEIKLQKHLEGCADCQRHFHELSRTITLIQSQEKAMAPANFTQQVVQNLPTEKGYVKYTRWLKTYPIITTAAILFLFMVSGVFSVWSSDHKLVVSKQENLIIQGDTVIVPEGVTVKGDVFVKNGNLKVEGFIDGNVTLINGTNLSSTGEVSGEWTHITKVFGWIWYKLQELFAGIFSFGTIQYS